MKKILFISILILTISAVFTPAKAHAFAFGFTELFTTDSASSTTPKYFFDFDEIPHLYMKLNTPKDTIAGTLSGWIHTDDSIGYIIPNIPNNNTEHWDAAPLWTSIKKTGKWNASAVYFDSAANVDFANVKFFVTPEPATFGLLLMGGIPLFFRRKQKPMQV